MTARQRDPRNPDSLPCFCT